jgi:nitrate/TMAO reductase-like tetraheme cytochrome c subunit
MATWAEKRIQSVDIPYIEAEWQASAMPTRPRKRSTTERRESPVVSASCARCHSSIGFQDFLGADGSAAGVVDKAPPVGTVIDCMACHNAATATLSSVAFPSGVVVNNLGGEAVCMQCHQGRQSTVSVDTSIKTNADPNSWTWPGRSCRLPTSTISPPGPRFMAASRRADTSTPARPMTSSSHVQGLDTCIDCHDQHSLEVHLATCAECHPGIEKK